MTRFRSWQGILVGVGLVAAAAVAVVAVRKARQGEGRSAGSPVSFSQVGGVEETALAPYPKPTEKPKPPKTEFGLTYHRPTGLAPYHTQVQIGFNAPVAPLTNVTDAQRAAVLSHILLSPKAKGTFRLVGIQAVVFSPQKPFPAATEYTVTVTAGLTDIYGRRLKKDVSWKFHTAPLRLSLDSPGRGCSLRPMIEVSCNGAVKPASLRKHLECYEVQGTQRRKLDAAWTITPSKDNPPPVQEVTNYRRSYTYMLRPKRSLKKNTRYFLTITRGVEAVVGNLPTAEARSVYFSTYAPLAFSFHSSDCGDRLQRRYWVLANNTLVAKTTAGAFTISPAVGGKTEWGTLKRNGEHISLPGAKLQPDTDYTITINTKVRDEFGQRLSQPWTHTFHTSHLRPKLRVQQGNWILSTETAPALPYQAVNPRVVNSRLLSLSEHQVLYWVTPLWKTRWGSVAWDLMNKHRDKAHTDAQVFEVDAAEVRDLSLTPALGRSGRGLVVYELETTEKDTCGDEEGHTVRRNGAVLRTNLGIHAQLLPTGMDLWATHLNDGSPVVEGEVKVYRYGKERWSGYRYGSSRRYKERSLPHPVLLYQGKTGKDGRVRIPATKLETPGSAGRRTLASSRGLMVFVREQDDMALVSSRGWLCRQWSGWDFDVRTGWDGPDPVSLGALFSDRSLYQPTEDVKLKGIVRFRSGDRIHVPRRLRFTVTMAGPRGKETPLGQVTTDEFGTFSLTVKPKPGEPLGYYRVTASSKNPPLFVAGSFRRADFRPPRYKARLSTDKQLYLVGETIKAEAGADYLFGAPLAGGEAAFRVNTRAQEFRPKGWDEFGFSVPEWLEQPGDKEESPEKSLVRKEKTLDDDGKARLEVPVVAEDVPRPMRYSLEVSAEDVSGQSVGASTDVSVLPYPRLTGVRVRRTFVAAGKPCPAEIIVTDPTGKPVPGVRLRVELVSVRWEYREVQHPWGRSWEYTRKHKTVATQAVTSAKAPVSVKVTPPQSGEYLIVARFAGRKPTGTEGGTWLYVWGRGPVGSQAKTEIELHTDKDEYQVGDEATVMIPSPFKRAKLLVTVEREKVFTQGFREVEQGAATFKFRVTDEMIPNVYVQATLSELATDGKHLFADSDHKPFRVGVVEASVSRAPHALSVHVSPRDPECRPGQQTVVNCRVKDAAGKPATAQLTVMVVDEAILQLTGYRPPDLLESVWEHRVLSAEIWDNRSRVVAAKKKMPLPPKGWGYGGGGLLGGIPAARLRKDFRHLAYFDPDVRTDKRGYARCEFKLPDNLTTWRVLVVAVTRDNDFGSGEAAFVVKQPLMLQGLLPRFARVDDSFTAGVAVNNQSGVNGAATVRCTVVTGRSRLKPAAASGVMKTTEIRQNRTAALRFPKTAVNVGDCVLRFDCKFTGRDAAGKPVTAADRMELPLVVQEPGYWETVSLVREVPGRLTVPLRITDAVRTDLGQVKVSLSSTAFGNLAPDAEWLLRYPYNCAEQRSSRLLGLLAIEEPAKKFGLRIHSDKPLKQIIEENLRGLLDCQTSSGGFGVWSHSHSASPLLSAQVAIVLAEARRRGYEVPAAARKRLIKYLKQNHDGFFTTKRAIRHFWIMQAQALLALGEEFTDHYEELVTERQTLPLGDQVRLDMLLQQHSDWATQAAKLYENIKKHVWITAGTAHLEEWRSEDERWWGYTSSRLALAALGLKLDLLVAPKDERVAKTARYLWSTRRNRRWRTTYDTARVMDALCRYVELREAKPPRFIAGVSVGGRRAKEFRFYGYKLGQQEETVPLSQLGPGEHKLVVEKEGRGTLYSTVQFSYVPKGKQPPQCQGFFINRTMVNLRTKKPVKSSVDEVRVGDVVRVKLTLNAPQDAWNVIVEAPVPAGFEPVDTSFKTTPDWMRRRETSRSSWRWNPFDHREFHRDHVALFAQNFPAGVYEYEYLLQAVNPGTFTYPPSRLYRMYQPEEFGATESGRIRITAR